jgi:hypothetical protein
MGFIQSYEVFQAVDRLHAAYVTRQLPTESVDRNDPLLNQGFHVLHVAFVGGLRGLEGALAVQRDAADEGRHDMAPTEDLEVEARPTDACVLELQHVSMLDGLGAGVTVEIEVGVAMVRVRRGVDHATQELVLDALEARENRARTLS